MTAGGQNRLVDHVVRILHLGLVGLPEGSLSPSAGVWGTGLIGYALAQRGWQQPAITTRVFMRKFLATSILLAVAGCASAPPLSSAGASVRAITTDQAKACKFVRVVQYNDRINSMGKDPTVMKAIGETSLRNEVGAAGANAYVSTKEDSNWFLGNVAYQGEAYLCP